MELSWLHRRYIRRTFSSLPGAGTNLDLRAFDNLSGQGGFISMQAGHGGGGSTGGYVNIRAGNNGSNGSGGQINLMGGSGTNVGGYVTLEAGSQSASFGLGGNIVLVGGNATGTGSRGGKVQLIPGLNPNGSRNNVEITQDASLILTGSAGAIVLDSTVTALAFIGSRSILSERFSVATSTFVAVNGRVGIGTATPVALLDVNGASQFGAAATKSTFTASPGGATYALQLSSGITISGGGPINLTTGGFIRFADGTTQVTAPSGGGGDAVLAATQTFSGINTFTSTLNISSGAVLAAAPSSTPTPNSLYAESAVKAFLVLTGTGTVTIQSSHNISSIVDNGTGDYTFNFQTPFAGVNYAYSCSGRRDDTTAGWCAQVVGSGAGSMTASSVRLKTTDTVGGGLDWDKALFIFAGRQ